MRSLVLAPEGAKFFATKIKEDRLKVISNHVDVKKFYLKHFEKSVVIKIGTD